MSTITNTDNSRLDLSDDREFAELLERRRKLAEIEKEGLAAGRERREIDDQIIVRLGNSQTAITADNMVSIKTVMRKETLMKAYSYKQVMVLKG